MKPKTLSEKITASALKVLEQWERDNPNENPLNIVQQLNYSSLELRTLGAKMESDYKKDIKGKITNELH